MDKLSNTHRVDGGPTAAALDPRIPALVPGFDAPFFQAGLAGYSDGAMRVVARQQGCPYCITEALLDRTLIHGGRGRRREDPDQLIEECGLGDVEDNRIESLDDHPIAGQVMGSEPHEMGAAGAILAEMGFDVVDVNLACPVKKVKRKHRGGHFLTAPLEAIEVLRAVRAAVPPSIPTTVKLRRSFDDTPEMAANFERIFAAAYELGYAWATVHCRTVVQKYEGPARWEFLADLTRRYPDRLVFGSGDIWEAPDIFSMLATTGVHAVAVARGCIGNPWIFRQAHALWAGQEPASPSLTEQALVLREHLRLAMRLHGESLASRRMRKFGIRFARHHETPEAVRAAFIRCQSLSDWLAVLASYYPGAAHGAAAGTAEHTTPRSG